MNPSAPDQAFTGSIPEIYDSLLVPLIFEPYARDLAGRLRTPHVSHVLEIAAGTGALTRELASVLPETTSIIATDLNQPMLDRAAAAGTRRAVHWQQADALDLPFSDEMFDAVVCQFGAMFFPDKRRAYAEMRRVLKPGGRFIFNVWDRIEENEFAHATQTALDSLFPHDPPRFLARTPHGYHQRETIESELVSAGFPAGSQFITVAARSRADSPRIPALAYCQGTPLRNEIEAHGASELAKAVEHAADHIARRFGQHALDGKIQAHVITATR